MSCAKNCSLRFVILAVLFALAIPTTATAVITASGDVYPGDPNTWTNSTCGFIGYLNTTVLGEVEVNGGSDLFSNYGLVNRLADSLFLCIFQFQLC